MELKKMWNVAKGNKFACRQGLNGRLFPPLGEEMEKWFFRLQTDYDRHLEELLEQVEGLLIGILRKNLRKENLDQVAHYHALLENVRHLSKGESLLYWNHLMESRNLFILSKMFQIIFPSCSYFRNCIYFWHLFEGESSKIT